MLKIKNTSGEELMRIEDNGKEIIKDAKLKEAIEKAQKDDKQKDE